MKYACCLSMLAGLLTTVYALPAVADIPPELEDPGCVGVNKEPAHATLMPYASLKEALAARRADSSFARSLNGTWKFHYVPHPDQRPGEFYKPEFDVSKWDDIPVPSCWQLLGYGTPSYSNISYIGTAWTPYAQPFEQPAAAEISVVEVEK